MEKSYPPETKKIVIFLPISIPGSGKSFLMNHFKAQLNDQHKGKLHVISSDVLRKQLMDELSSKEPSLPLEELFSKTSKRAIHHFNEELAKLLKRIAKEDNQEISYLFIDKNNLPNAIPKILDTLQERCSSSFDQWRFVGLYPDSYQQHRVSNKIVYPFSLNFMMNCLERVQNRKGTHETLNSQGYKSANILFSFINGFRNIQLDDESIAKEFKIHLAIKMPMTLENLETDSQFDKETIESFNEVIKEDNQRFDTERNIDNVNNFLTLIQSKKMAFQQVSLENIKGFFENVIESCNRLFKFSKEKNKNHNPKIEEENKEHDDDKIPAKLPLYLSIMSNDENKTKDLVYNYILSSLKWYIGKHPENKFLQGELKYFDQNFRFPNSLHVTTLFLGGDRKKATTQNFKDFKEGVPHNIEIEAIVYVPQKIVCGICFFDEKIVKIENKYPHMTMMIGKWSPKNSNDILTTLFTNNKSSLKDQYSQDYFKKQESIDICIADISVNLGNRIDKTTAYVLRENKTLTIEARTKNFY